MKMARTLRILSFTLACLVFLGLVAVSRSRGSSNGDVCKSSDSHCFVDKFSTLRLSRVEPIKVGHVRNVELEPGKHYQMKTLALQPPIYEIPDFLSAEECDHIISLAEKQGLKNSSTVGDSLEKDIESLGSNSKEEFVYWDMDNSSMIDLDEMLKGLELNVDFIPERNHVLQMYSETGIDKNNDGLISLEEFLHRNKTEIAIFVRRVKTVLPHTRSRYSSQAWLDNTGDPIMNNIQRRVQKLTQLPMELIQASEYLQVVSYSHNGHYNCHLDSDFPQRDKECCHILNTDKSNCRICRFGSEMRKACVTWPRIVTKQTW
ncbi:transmembrane prolyl 4-hydroxylase isoform X2 [Nematostella vectensis]|uniref:transmembrane prolyl 4-hydroxylase isoform X2 n=1 Tax=Nematostella vectensis TaxID=45351 RepID=UPI002076E6FE|nr:transmembrane prolyl 4-hydroxylase isoform X2 [Nematostella vectensis]